MADDDCKELARQLASVKDKRHDDMVEYRRLDRWCDKIAGQGEHASPTQTDNAESYQGSMRHLNRHINEADGKIKSIKAEMKSKKCA
jgi:hypothetical protein